MKGRKHTVTQMRNELIIAGYQPRQEHSVPGRGGLCFGWIAPDGRPVMNAAGRVWVASRKSATFIAYMHMQRED